MMTVKLLQKDYMHLASCLVPMGDQIGMSQEEIATMLKAKTRRFTEEDIEKKFGMKSNGYQKRSRSVWDVSFPRLGSLARDCVTRKWNYGRVETELSKRKSA